MSMRDIPPSINGTESFLTLPSHLDAFQLAPAATTTAFAAEGSAARRTATETSTVSVSPSQHAFSEAVSALSRDMPILMHGSGDVVPSEVNPDTVQLISELTVRYISNLVDAALDAQQLLAGGQATTPPPPRYPRSRQPALPFVPPKENNKKKKKSSDEQDSKDKDSKELDKLLKKRPRRPDVDYWDEPLPEPKIVKRKLNNSIGNNQLAVGSRSFFSFNQGGRARGQQKDEQDDKEKIPHVDRWVGVAGVDLWEQSRSRKVYVQMPDAVGVKCFLFPICHDGFLYGKVRQILATKRQIAPLLVDSVLLKEVEKEGVLVKRPRRKKVEFKKDSGDADVEEEPEQEEEEDNQDNEPAWPGLEFLLPVHTFTETGGMSF